MATLTVQQASTDGVVPAFAAAAAGGDEFSNNGNVQVTITNGLVDLNVTFATPSTYGGQAVADQTVLVSASTTKVFSGFAPAVYNDVNGKVQMTYDDEANVTIATVRG